MKNFWLARRRKRYLTQRIDQLSRLINTKIKNRKKAFRKLKK